MEITKCPFEPGELYLFSGSSPDCDPLGSLWGLFDCIESDRMRLELASFGLDFFYRDFSLPDGFRYARLARRWELRDFFFNYGVQAALRIP